MIVNLFLKELKNDLIYNNDTFIFPEKGFGFVYITDKTNVNSDKFMFNFETEGKTYGPKLFLNKELVKRNKRLYRMRFTQTGRKQIKEQIAKKHYYA